MEKAKEKAAELVEKFKPHTRKWNLNEHEWEDDLPVAKQCALIAVYLVIDLADRASDYGNMFKVMPDMELTTEAEKELKFWEQVKAELNNM